MDAIITYLLPCAVTAFLCCILFYFFLKNSFSQLPEVLKHEIFNPHSLSSKPVDNLRSDILNQFDDFMQNRLTVAMPVLKIFVDDALILELKSVFEKELTSILPEVIHKNFSTQVLHNALHAQLSKRVKTKLVFFFLLIILLSLFVGVMFMLLLH